MVRAPISASCAIRCGPILPVAPTTRWLVSAPRVAPPDRGFRRCSRGTCRTPPRYTTWSSPSSARAWASTQRAARTAGIDSSRSIMPPQISGCSRAMRAAQTPQHRVRRVGPITVDDWLGVAGHDEQPRRGTPRNQRCGKPSRLVEQPVGRRDVDWVAGRGGRVKHLLHLGEVGDQLRIEVLAEDRRRVDRHPAIQAAAQFGAQVGIGEHQPLAVDRAVAGRYRTRRPGRHVPPVPRNDAIPGNAVAGTRRCWCAPAIDPPRRVHCGGDPVAGVLPRGGGQVGVGLGWVWRVGGTRGVGGVERGVEADRVVGVAGQGAQRCGDGRRRGCR